MSALCKSYSTSYLNSCFPFVFVVTSYESYVNRKKESSIKGKRKNRTEEKKIHPSRKILFCF
jgi:hypothetical protein